MKSANPEQVRHYARLVRASMGTSFDFVPEAETASRVQVERGTAFPMALCGQGSDGRIDRLIELQPVLGVAVVDRAGTARPPYLGLLVYGWLQALRSGAAAPGWEPALRSWCGRVEGELVRFELPTEALPASRGGAATGAAWQARALYLAGGLFQYRRWSELAAHTLGSLSAHQGSDGAFLRAGPADHPEAHDYDELAILQAVAGYAVESNDPLATAAVMQAADRHVGRTQPDHATQQPWGLFAFAWRQPAHELADTMLHALSLSQTAGRDGVTSMLLADTLYSLRLLEPGRA